MMARFKPRLLLKVGCLLFILAYVNQLYRAISKSSVRDNTFDGIFLNAPRQPEEMDVEGNKTLIKPPRCVAQLPKSQDDLLELLGFERHWEWISQRVQQNWQYLQQAVKTLQKGPHAEEFFNRTCLHVLVLPGLLTQTNFAQRSSHGGPLGELLQWADLISTIHALGHKISLRSSIYYTGLDLRALKAGEQSRDGCSSEEIDMIFTDLGGHTNLPKDIQRNYSNKIHVLDAYGTEVMYNVPKYAQDHFLARSAGLRDLNIKHFLTMYPETVDNSFLGFMVHPPNVTMEKEEIALLYGKEPKYLFGKEKFILTLRKFMEIHATMSNHVALMKLDVIENHGILAHSDYHDIAKKSKVFVGLGDPVEGPGMMEALARGCIIVQPKFNPPRSLHNIGKPTNRNLSSQLPYLERIGKPHVYTLDYNDHESFSKMLKEISDAKLKPLLPYEFSVEGYVHRLNAYLTTENACNKANKEAKSLQPEIHVVLSDVPDMSCTQVCKNKGLICDVKQFNIVNTEEVLKAKAHNKCLGKIVTKSDVHSPAIEKTNCVLQGDSKLFSCASYTNEGVYRICPCAKCDIHNSHFCPNIL